MQVNRHECVKKTILRRVYILVLNVDMNAFRSYSNERSDREKVHGQQYHDVSLGPPFLFACPSIFFASIELTITVGPKNVGKKARQTQMHQSIRHAVIT